MYANVSSKKFHIKKREAITAGTLKNRLVTSEISILLL